MSQEINIRLKADTREAVNSVKELEKQVAGLEGLQRKGDSEKGFLSSDDVQRFRRMSDDAKKVYRDFFDEFNKIKRDVESKKQELENALKRNASASTTKGLEREIRELEARRNIYQSQVNTMEKNKERMDSSTGRINGMSTNGGALSNLVMLNSKLLPMLGLTLSAGKLFNFVKSGMHSMKSEEEYMATIGTRVNGYNGNYDKARKDAEAQGLSNGNAYNAQSTMQVADTWSSLAGAKSASELWNATGQLQSMSRVTGIDANTLASQAGSLGRLGTFDSQTLKGFRDAMVGAIKETGMDGRDSEFVEAVSGLSQSVASGQLELSNSEFNQILGLQTLLGRTGIKGLQGEQGANMLSQLDSGIKNGGNAVDIMLGWGSKYQGYQGRWELEKLKSKGISDPEMLSSLFTNLESLGGKGNTAYQGMWLKENFGYSPEQAEALIKLAPQLKKGGLSKAEIEKVLATGDITSTGKQEDWTGSEAQRRAENDANKSNLSKYMANPVDRVWETIKEGFFSQPEALQSAELIGGVAGAGFLGSALGKRLFGSSIGGGGAGGGGVLSRMKGKASSLGKGAGKLVGPLGSALAMNFAVDAGDISADWLFGHKAGMVKSGGMFSNPLKQEVYEEDRQGAISKAWDWATPWDTKSEKKKKEQREAQTKQEQLISKEGEIVKKRQNATDSQSTTIDKERKNIDEMKTLLGTEASSSSATSSTGVISKLLGLGKGFDVFKSGADYLPRYFGISGSSSDSSSYFSSNSASGSNSEFLNKNLKSQSSMTAEQVNQWIAKYAPSDSLLRGKGETFLRASKESGLDVQYLVAHAAQETGWGTSNIAKNKSNFFGIGAFDASPYASAYGYDNADAGIVEGAKWIAKNYVNKGQDTLYKMRNNNGIHEYATDDLWDDNIAKIMSSAPTGSATAKGPTNGSVLKVEVSGGIDGLTKENNKVVAQALANRISSGSNVELAYEFRQGLGGNK